MFLILPSLQELFAEQILKVSNVTAKVVLFLHMCKKKWKKSFSVSSFHAIYFFFFTLCRAAIRRALGDVNCLSTSPFCFAKVVQFLAPFSRNGSPNCKK